jgi:Tfp pilus assembly protein PilF
MSRTLNVIDHLLARGRFLQDLGRSRDARRVLRQAAGFREMPAEAAEETQARLAEIELGRRRYRKARRHLTAALRHRPDSARYHYLMAAAIDAEDTGDPQRAAHHYRRSLALDPAQVDCLVDFGTFQLREGRTKAGLGCLRRAAELAPADPETIRDLADGLVLAGRSQEARDVLRTAIFRNPRDERFRRLWSDFQFQQLAEEQEAARQRPAGDEAPVLLPFVRIERPTPSTTVEGKIIRHDGPSPTPAPHGPRPSNRLFRGRQAE